MNRRRSGLVVALLCSAGLLVLGGCSQHADIRDGVSASDPPTSIRPDALTADVMPIDALIVDVLGRPLTEVSPAVDEARYAQVVKCMGDHGYEFSRTDLPEADSSPANGDEGNVRRLLNSIVSSSAKPGAAQRPPLTAVQRDDLAACFDHATKDIPDPLEGLLAWITKETRSISDATSSDSRVLAAKDAQLDCMRQLGFATPDMSEVSGPFIDRASPIIDALKAGTKDQQTALVELRSIADEEDAALQIAGQCQSHYMTVEKDVRRELETAFLETHASSIREAARKTKGQLKPLEQYFSG